ncbi:MAG: threonylcarbamoyl-AMP synthase [Dehalococcoidia bacterium]|nr:threonylcarbamoyl-AMP synthase [Dehalococcoidia bacterium]
MLVNADLPHTLRDASRSDTLPIVDPDQIDLVVRKLHSGGIVAIPTDTVYGVAALATSAEAVRALQHLKGRDVDQPIAVLIDSVVALAAHLEDPTALDGVVGFWPGALTAIVRARADGSLPAPVVSASGTIGVRKPDDVHARAVIRECGGLLAVTSANRHGDAPATSAQEVAATFGMGLMILDGGPRPGGLASTVVDLSGERPRVLREGQVTAADLGIEEP